MTLSIIKTSLGSRKRPDLCIGETGLWIDAKLSNVAYFSEKEQIENYTNRDDCKELWLLCLDAIDNGREFPIGNKKVKILFIKSYYEDLLEIGGEDRIERAESLRKGSMKFEKRPLAPKRQKIKQKMQSYKSNLFKQTFLITELIGTKKQTAYTFFYNILPNKPMVSAQKYIYTNHFLAPNDSPHV
ncbi:hypothetical protein [Neobacillus cucumis]|uniref:hypothetical protein n=1 Tax=Neobacillus cucumis TaxID=1740721 RepID=UPI0019628F32|nr:hypothetical protein [Neobacillus cucumis]MBM7654290.1 hypothetical protein [Neobacillus cucumis]